MLYFPPSFHEALLKDALLLGVGPPPVGPCESDSDSYAVILKYTEEFRKRPIYELQLTQANSQVCKSDTILYFVV